MRDHRKLKAFELADRFALSIYAATRHFPREETFGLTSQLRRAAVSVAANIVEGAARDSLKEYLKFLNIAFGSLREVGYYVDLSKRLGYLSEPESQELAGQHAHCSRVLSGLIKGLKDRREA